MLYLVSIWCFLRLDIDRGSPSLFFGSYFLSYWCGWMVVVLFIVAGGNECSMVVTGLAVFGIGFGSCWGSASVNDLLGVVCMNMEMSSARKNSCCTVHDADDWVRVGSCLFRGVD